MMYERLSWPLETLICRGVNATCNISVSRTLNCWSGLLSETYQGHSAARGLHEMVQQRKELYVTLLL